MTPEAKKVTQQQDDRDFKCEKEEKKITSSKQTIITAILYNRKRDQRF